MWFTIGLRKKKNLIANIFLCLDHRSPAAVWTVRQGAVECGPVAASGGEVHSNKLSRSFERLEEKVRRGCHLNPVLTVSADIWLVHSPACWTAAVCWPCLTSVWSGQWLDDQVRIDEVMLQYIAIALHQYGGRNIWNTYVPLLSVRRGRVSKGHFNQGKRKNVSVII